MIDKGAEIGAHIPSGAVLDPRALNELIPDWREQGAPLDTEVSEDQFMVLSETGATTVPNFILPACFQNHGNYIISLGRCAVGSVPAEALGVEIYPGFAGADILCDDENRVLGVITGDMGVDREVKPTAAYQQGMELRASTLFAEGCRGHPANGSEAKYGLCADADPQVRYRHQGTLGDRRRSMSRPGNAYRGLAARSGHLRRIVCLSLRRKLVAVGSWSA